MDETGLFFRLLPRYTLLMPFEDLSTIRGKKKAKERLSLVVCANATGTHNDWETEISSLQQTAAMAYQIF